MEERWKMTFIKLPKLILNIAMDKFISTNLPTVLDARFQKLLSVIHGYRDASHSKMWRERESSMTVDLNYEGQVLITEGMYEGYNALKIGYCVDMRTKEWLCLVNFYEEGDVYALPFDWIEKIDIDRI